MTIIDTPGLMDTQNRDIRHINNMIDKLRSIEKVHCFVFTLNGQEPRLDKGT